MLAHAMCAQSCANPNNKAQVIMSRPADVNFVIIDADASVAAQSGRCHSQVACTSCLCKIGPGGCVQDVGLLTCALFKVPCCHLVHMTLLPVVSESSISSWSAFSRVLADLHRAYLLTRLTWPNLECYCPSRIMTRPTSLAI